MKAVIVTGGKQYTVAEGDVLYIEKLNAEAESTVKFDQVLAVLDGENTKIDRRSRRGWCRRGSQGCQEWQGQEDRHHPLQG